MIVKNSIVNNEQNNKILRIINRIYWIQSNSWNKLLLNLLKDFKFKYTLIINVLLISAEVTTNKQENDAWIWVL